MVRSFVHIWYTVQGQYVDSLDKIGKVLKFGKYEKGLFGDLCFDAVSSPPHKKRCNHNDKFSLNRKSFLGDTLKES